MALVQTIIKMLLLPLIGGFLFFNDAVILVESFSTSSLPTVKPQRSSSSSSSPVALSSSFPSSSTQLAIASMRSTMPVVKQQTRRRRRRQQQLPKLGKNGLYQITNEDEYRTLLEHNADKLIVLKVFAPWCKTCKALAPKFQALARGLGGVNKMSTTTSNNNKNNELLLPIIFAELPHSKRNKDFVKLVLGISALPSVQLYAGNGMKVESFPCGPSKVSTILKPKLAQLIKEHVDIPTRQLKGVIKSTVVGVVVDNTEVSTNNNNKDPLQRILNTLFKMIRLKLRIMAYRYHREKDGNIATNLLMHRTY
jgi:thiol-disulfide isomerase/thioredoxin